MLYLSVFFYFLRLGIFGFGGPLALIATMQRDLVESQGWINDEEFRQAFALVKAMPGPVSFQMAVYFGRRHAGLLGGTLAALGLIFPSFVMMILFGLFYSTLQTNPSVHWFLLGMQAAALGVIAAGLRALILPHQTKISFWILILLAGLFTHASPHLEPLVIVSFGVIWVLRKKTGLLTGLSLPIFLFGAESSVGVWQNASRLPELAWVCFKAGAFVFGTGLAIVPLLEADFVTRLGWLSHPEFMNALAFGQITPGPVVITATFIGYKVSGFMGAVVGTVCMFFPSYFHMMTWFPPMVRRMAKLTWISDFIFAAVAAVVGSIAVTLIALTIPWQHEPDQWLLALVVFGLAIFSKIPSWLLIPAAGLVTVMVHQIRT